MTAAVRAMLRCPACHAQLRSSDDSLTCARSGCERRYPVVDGIPVLIDEDRSVFSIADFVSGGATTFAPENRLEKVLSFLPGISRNVTSGRNYDRLAALIAARTPCPRVLVVGGSILGQGMDRLTARDPFDLVESDVSFGPRTTLICDAHDLPFDDGSFDAVIAQAMLEHVVDPYRCVDEMHRVLRRDGIVYAETPFIQQVHMGRFDFTRFTHLGHRRLFRKFDEIDSGAVCGPAMALAWSYQHLLLSMADSRIARGIARAFASLTSFYLKYLDDYLIDRPAALDAASAVYFLGTRSEEVLTDRQLVQGYRGHGTKIG